MNIFSIFFGVLLSSIGLLFIVLYTNLLTMGYSFLEFVQFISKRFECLLFLFGMILIFLGMERWRKNVLLLRLFTKFRKGRDV